MTALKGIVVLDLSRYLPGPYCTLMLGDYGADVIRIEQPSEVIKKRRTFGQAELSDEELERLKAFEISSRNKRSLLLDLRKSSSREVMERLIKRADVLVSDYRPGVLDAAGYDYESVRALNPRLIYCAISLCGQTGPYRDVPGHDPVSLAVAGVLTRFSSGSDSPRTIGVPISDINSALHAVVGILLALRARETTGTGQLVDVAMSDTAFAFVTSSLSRLLATGKEPPIGINMANNGVWRTRDGRHVCTTDMEPRYWEAFCDLIDRPQWKRLLHKRAEYETELRDIFLTRDRDEWIELFREAGTQGAPVLSLSETIDDPHARARGVVTTTRDDTGAEITHIGPLIKLSDTPGDIRHVARMPGADSRDVLTELGFSQTEIHALIKEIAAGSDARLAKYLQPSGH
jgi:crotonobetainyl-CoA:carnitine CoA-transferase CaiB-like acyl-CoA transferase